MQESFSVAVVMPTTLRPGIRRAVESIFDQDIDSRIQIMIGIDKALGDKRILDELSHNCPENIAITVFDPGYSTSVRHGGIYSNQFGGALRTILSYAANSRYVTYLDDDNWYAPNHLSDLLNAIPGYACAYSLRWFVNENTYEIICEDDFISVGPGKGIFAKNLGGFVDTNCLILDKMKCHMLLPLWCTALFPDGSGEDRQVFKMLNARFAFNSTGRSSVYYVLETNKYTEIASILEKKGYVIR